MQGPKLKRNVFGIAHFAGDVIYNCIGFTDKNKNSQNRETHNILCQSSESIIQLIFSKEYDSQDLEDEGKVKKGLPPAKKSISGQFVEQLQNLMKILDQSKALYVRCIKPNTRQMPIEIDSKLVAKQLRCAGMLEAIRIRKGGYPVRRDVLSFV